MEARLFILCLSILSVGANVPNLPVQAANKDGDATLAHNSSLFEADVSKLAVDCGQGTVKLTLRKDTGTELQSGRIDIASAYQNAANDAGCSSSRATYAQDITVETTQGIKCERREVDGHYEWDVMVIEYNTPTVDAYERFVRSKILVKCAVNYNAPGTVNETGPAVLNEDAVTHENDIKFTLEKNLELSDYKHWVFDLVPNGDFAPGFSYQIKNLSVEAKDSGVSPVKLIINGCRKDKQGTTATPAANHGTTIKIRPFQFPDRPEAVVNFTVSVSVCQFTIGERCDPVKRDNDTDCTATPPGSRQMRSRRQIFESFLIKPKIFTATVTV